MNDLIHPRVLPRTICRILGRAALFILGAIALSACQLPAEPDAIESQSIHIRGSGALMPLAQLTAETLMQNQPGSLVTVSGGGSGRGILSLIDGTCDIALASSTMIPELEALAAARGVTVESAIIAYDAIVPFVHPDNPVQNLELKQLREIYAGSLVNWSDAGGPDLAISLVSRNASSGTYEAWKQLVLGPRSVLSPQALLLESQPMKDYVVSHPEALGYSAFSYIDDTIKPLSVDGIAPTRSTIESGLYPLRRPLYVYICQDAPERVRTFVSLLQQTASEQAESLGLFAVED